MKKSNILLYVLAGVLGALVLAFFVVMGSDSFACVVQKWFGTENKKETLQFLGWIISGFITFFGLFVFNRRAAALDENNRLIEKGHIQDRFRSAVDHLSNKESVSGRIASFYELFNLARDNKDNYAQTVLDILCAHLRYTKNAENADQELTESQTLVNILFSSKAKEIFGKLDYDLRRAKLPKVDFRGMHKPEGKVNFSAADLSEAIFDKADLSGFDFQNATLHKAKFWKTNLENTNFIKADFSKATFLEVDLSHMALMETDFSGAQFSGANFTGSVLINADFSDAGLSEVNFFNADMAGSNLSDADLSRAILSKAYLSKANLSKANLSEAKLHGATLSKANFSDADLSDADLRDTDLSSVDLRNADLRGTDLSKVKNLQAAKLSGTDYDDDTKFPEGFNPKDHGMG